MKQITYFYQDETGSGYETIKTSDPKRIARFEQLFEGSGTGCIYIRTCSISDVEE